MDRCLKEIFTELIITYNGIKYFGCKDAGNGN